MKPIKINEWLAENKKTWGVWLMLLGFSLLFTLSQYTRSKGAQVDPAGVDTYIPKGFVLLPVELSNGPSLDGLLQSRGVVDLYTGDPARQEAQKAAGAVKIIRSPRNPSYFAVLVPEDKAPFLIRRFQAFHAVIQNPAQQKVTNIIQPRKKRKRTITIELDNLADFN